MTDKQRQLFEYLKDGLRISTIAKSMGTTHGNISSKIRHYELNGVIKFDREIKNKKEYRDINSFKLLKEPVGIGFSYKAVDNSKNIKK